MTIPMMSTIIFLIVHLNFVWAPLLNIIGFAWTRLLKRLQVLVSFVSEIHFSRKSVFLCYFSDILTKDNKSKQKKIFKDPRWQGSIASLLTDSGIREYKWNVGMCQDICYINWAKTSFFYYYFFRRAFVDYFIGDSRQKRGMKNWRGIAII